MAATLLRSERAIYMSVFIIRAFVQMAEMFAANATILRVESDRATVGSCCGNVDGCTPRILPNGA